MRFPFCCPLFLFSFSFVSLQQESGVAGRWIRHWGGWSIAGFGRVDSASSIPGLVQTGKQAVDANTAAGTGASPGCMDRMHARTTLALSLVRCPELLLHWGTACYLRQVCSAVQCSRLASVQMQALDRQNSVSKVPLLTSGILCQMHQVEEGPECGRLGSGFGQPTRDGVVNQRQGLWPRLVAGRMGFWRAGGVLPPPKGAAGLLTTRCT